MDETIIDDFLDEWNDEDFGVEYAKFFDADPIDSTLFDDDVSVLYFEPIYSSIKPTINQWNKKRKQLRINTITRCCNTPYDSDQLSDNKMLFLDMGARLYNAMKLCKKDNWTYVKMIKISSKTNKFDVQYYPSEYKLSKQKKVPGSKKKEK
jgi:hypothetical protein